MLLPKFVVRFSLILCVITLSGETLVFGQVFGETETKSFTSDAPASRNTASPNVSRSRLLLLTTGRIVTGKMTQSATGYLIEKPTGHLFIPFTQVHMEGENMADLYRKLEKTLPQRTANEHLKVATWCLTYQLYPQARQQIRSALLLEPERREARNMLVRLDALENSPPDTAPTKEYGDTRLVQDYDTKLTHALARLPAAVSENYVSRIQPLMLKKCGNASCHGSQVKNSFQLNHVRVGYSGHRGLTEKNLGMVLKAIQENKLEQRLLPHGGIKPVAYRTGLTKSQETEFRTWIRLASQSTGVAAAAPETNNRSTPNSFEGSDSPFTSESFRNPGKRPFGAGGKLPGQQKFQPQPRNLPSQGQPLRKNDPFLEKILDEERPDAFDPDEFNQRFSGTPSRNTTPSSSFPAQRAPFPPRTTRPAFPQYPSRKQFPIPNANSPASQGKTPKATFSEDRSPANGGSR